jgi:hypothetical protein
MAALSGLSGVFTTAGGWNAPTGGSLTNPASTQVTFDASGSSLMSTTASTWDLTDSTFSWKMPSFPTTSSAPSIELRSAASVVQWRIFRGASGWTCRQGTTNVGSAIPDATVTSNPYLRFRHVTAGTSTVYFEYSPDGTNWTTHTSVAVSTSAITSLIPRFQISAVPTGPAWVVQEVNGTAAPGTITTASASSITSAGVWTGTGNVFSSNDVYATDTGSVQNTEYPFDASGFNFSAITSGSTINAVRVTIEAKTGTAARAQIKGEAYDGASLLTGSLALVNLTAADVNYTFNPTATLTNVQSANFKVRVTNKRTSASASTTSVDYVKVEVEWTAPTFTTHNAAATLAVVSNLSSPAATAVAVHEALAPRTVTAAPVAAATKSFSNPTDLTGLQSWYDADDASSFTFGTGTQVSQWNDKSGLGRHLTQATGSLQPQRNGTQNSRTTVTFDGTDDYMDTASFTVAQPITVFFAGDIVSDSDQGWFSSVGGNFQVYIGAGNVYLYCGTTPSGLQLTGSYTGAHTWRFQANGSSTAGYKDGTLLATGDTGSSGTTTGWRLAERNLTSGYRLTGEVFEIIVYDRILTGGEITQVEDYLTAKWITAGPVTQSAAATLALTSAPASSAIPVHEGLAARSVTSAQAAVALAAHEALATQPVTSGLAASAAVTHEATASLAVTSAPAAAASVTTAAHNFSALTTDFSDTVTWDVDPLATATSSQVTLPADVSQPVVETDTSDWVLDEQRVSWRWSVPPAASGVTASAEMQPGPSPSSANMLRFIYSNGTLFVRHHVASTVTTLASYTWDPASPFLAFRDTGTTQYWETSPDGSSWTTVGSAATGLSVTGGALIFRTNAPGAAPTYGSLVIDKVNSTAVVQSAVSSLAVTSAPTASSVAVHEGSAAAPATAALASVGTVTEAVWTAVSSLPVTAALASAGSATHEASAALAVAASSAAPATVTEAVWTIAGSLQVSASQVAAASATHEASAPLAVTASSAAPATVTEAVWAAVSSLPVTASSAAAVSATHEASAALAVVATSAAPGTVTEAVWDIAGTLAVSAAGSATSAADRPAAAAVAGTAALVAASSSTHEAVAALAVTSALSANPGAVTSTRDADSALAVSATLTSTSGREVGATASLAVTATVGASSVPTHEALATQAVTSAIVAAGNATLPVAASLGVTSTAASTTSVSRSSASASPVTATLTAAASVTRAATSALAVTAGRTSAVALAASGTGTLAVSSTNAASPVVTHQGVASLAGTAGLAASGSTVHQATAALGVSAGLLCEAVEVGGDRLAEGFLAAQSVLASTGSKVTAAAGAVSSTAVLASAATLVHDASASLSVTVVQGSTAGLSRDAAGSLAVTVDRSAQIAIIRGGRASLSVQVDRGADPSISKDVTARLAVTAAPAAIGGHILTAESALNVTAVMAGAIGKLRSAAAALAVVVTRTSAAIKARNASSSLNVSQTSQAAVGHIAQGTATLSLEAELEALVDAVNLSEQPNIDTTVGDRFVVASMGERGVMVGVNGREIDTALETGADTGITVTLGTRVLDT